MAQKINIAVLDFSTCQVAIYEGADVEPTDECIEDFLTGQGHHISNCNYMYTPNEIEVNNY